MSGPSSSSSPFFSMRDENEIHHQLQQQQQQQLIMSSSAPPPPPPPAAPSKKRRNQPGNPNPDAEVIALSPKTLMATNRFVCEVCNKGFQREQNLQLHRRGHNLPWKLRQKSSKDVVRRKVYLCPEPTCVHHDPSRALGDLTGIKKHFSRKHGEKKYKCDKCSKKYAVQSDWKAHSKTCGTREYRCDCGTLFSRRDSFITHRAFCDALAQESARNLNPTTPNSLATPHLFGLSQSHHHQTLLMSSSNQPDLFRFSARPTSHFESLVGPGSPSPSMGLFQPDMISASNNKSALHGLMQLPQLQINNNLGFGSCSNGGGGEEEEEEEDSTHLFPPSSAGNNNNNNNMMMMSMAIPSLYSSAATSSSAAHMSATALLQKAAQLGSTTSNDATSSSLFKSLGKSESHHHHMSFGVFGGANPSNNNHHLQDLVNSTAGGGGSSSFGGLYEQQQIMNDEYRRYHAISSKLAFGDMINDDRRQGQSGNYNNINNTSGGFGGLEQGRLTRDFLGVGGEVVRNVRDHHNGVEMSALDHHSQSQGKSSTSHSQTHSHSFGGGSFS